MDGVKDFLGHESILSCQVCREGRNAALKRNDVNFGLLRELSQNVTDFD